MAVRSIALALSSALMVLACNESSSLVAPTPVRAASFDEDPCNPLIQYCEDPGGGGQPPAPPGISLGFSAQYCQVPTPGTLPDADGDSINDTCEFELAAAFAPMLVQRGEIEPGWTDLPGLPVIPGEYLFAVGNGNALNAIRLAYLPAYYKDLGNLYTGGASHSGDAEFIMIDVAYNTQTARWYTNRVFLSSHCGAYDPILGFFEADPNCRWWGNNDFEYLDGVTWGAPVVWVADAKHANYKNYSECQVGTTIDRCDAGARHLGPESND